MELIFRVEASFEEIIEAFVVVFEEYVAGVLDVTLLDETAELVEDEDDKIDRRFSDS